MPGRIDAAAAAGNINAAEAAKSAESAVAGEEVAVAVAALEGSTAALAVFIIYTEGDDAALVSAAATARYCQDDPLCGIGSFVQNAGAAAAAAIGEAGTEDALACAFFTGAAHNKADHSAWPDLGGAVANKETEGDGGAFTAIRPTVAIEVGKAAVATFGSESYLCHSRIIGDDKILEIPGKRNGVGVAIADQLALCPAISRRKQQ